MSAPTWVGDFLELLENIPDLRPLVHFLAPASLSELPDRQAHHWGLEAMRFCRSFTLGNKYREIRVVVSCEWDISHYRLGTNCSNLDMRAIARRTQCLDNDYRQGMYVGLIRQFSPLSPRSPVGNEEFGGAVANHKFTVEG